MKLKKAEIKNFLSIKDAAVEFNPTCRVLVGINESGKSNILKAVKLLDATQKVEKKYVREVLSSEDVPSVAYVKFIFSFEKGDLDEIVADFKENFLFIKDVPVISHNGKGLNIEDFCKTRIEAVYHIDLLTQKRSARYFVLGKEYKVLNNLKKVSDTCPGDYEVVSKSGETFKLSGYQFVNLDEFNPIDPAYLVDVKDLSDIQETLGNIHIEKVEEWLPDVIYWEYNESYLLPSRIPLDGFISDPTTCIPLARMFNLAGIENARIANEVNTAKGISQTRLSNFLRKVADKNTEYFKQVWEEYPEVSFELKTDGSDIVATVKDSDNNYELNQRSDGFKRFITFLLLISTQSNINTLQNSVLIIDEPEISLHPTGVRFLRDELLKISQTNVVLFSTHSIFMIDEKVIARHYLVKKKKEITKLEVVGDSNIQDEEVIYKSLGYSIFSNLKEWNLIFEGWRDKDLFFRASKTTLPTRKKVFKELEKFGFCHSQGVKHIQNITPAFEAGNRNCLILSDADAIAKDKKREYENNKGYGFWYTYHDFDPSFNAVYTAEDFFEENYFLQQLKNTTDKNSKPEFLAADINDAKGRIESVRGWYKRNSITQIEGEALIGELKDALLTNLTIENIADTYYTYINKVNETLKVLAAKEKV